MDIGEIRRITIGDLSRLIELELKCFNQYIAYTPKQLNYLVTRANSNCLAETISGLIRGFIIVLYKNRTKVAGIETLNVDPLFQGKGIGKKLLYAAERDMFNRGIERIRLEVSVGNTSAIKLYEKSGFRINKLLKNFYYYKHYNSHDAFQMIKDITT